MMCVEKCAVQLMKSKESTIKSHNNGTEETCEENKYTGAQYNYKLSP